MSPVSCRSDKDKITVGEHAQLNCTGDISSEFSLEKSQFKLEEANKYTVKILKTKAAGTNEFALDFTLYAPGDYKISDLVLTDGVNEINLNGANIKVESVIKPSSDGKPPEPFGALLPLGIAIPVYYYMLLAAAVLALAVYAFFKAKRLSYYNKLKAKLKDYNSPLAPDTQFYKSIRAAEKADYPLEQIEKAFRLYNVRAYQVPLFDLSNSSALKYFKRNYPGYKNTRLHLLKLLDELDEMQKNKSILNWADKHEFIKKLYRYVETHKGPGE